MAASKRFRYVPFVLVLMLLAAFAAPVAVAQEVRLHLWHMWTANREPVLLEAVKRFEEAHPGIKVDVTLGDPSSASAGGEKMVVAWAAGVGPDVGMMHAGLAQSYAAGDLIMPLDRLAATEGPSIDSLVIPAVAEMIKDPAQGGQTFYLPMLISTQNILYYNRQLFREAGLDENRPPETHSALISAAERLTRLGGDGIPTQLGFEILKGTWQGNSSILELLMNQWGSSLFSLDGKVVLPDMSLAVETVEWMRDVAQRIADDPMTGGYSFTDQTQAMLQADESVWFSYTDRFPDLDMGMAVFPAPDGQPLRTSASPGWGWGISSQTDHPREAWQLVKWLATHVDGGGQFVWTQGRLSAGSEALRHPRNSETHPYWQTLVDIVEHSVPTGTICPGLQEGNLGRITIGNAVQAAVINEVATLGGLEDAKRTLQASCDQWWASNAR